MRRRVRGARAGVGGGGSRRGAVTLLGGGPLVAPISRAAAGNTRERAGPERRRGRGRGQPFYELAQRAAYERDAALGLAT